MDASSLRGGTSATLQEISRMNDTLICYPYLDNEIRVAIFPVVEIDSEWC